MGKGSIMFQGKSSLEEAVTLLNVWRQRVSQNLKVKVSKQGEALLNLTQICLEVRFTAEAAAVAAENICVTQIQNEDLTKTCCC